MAGISTHIRGAAPRCTRRLVLAGVAAVLGLAVWTNAPGGTPSAAAATCPALPVGLSPTGPGPTRFTMLIRINQQVNVDTWTNFNESTGGLGDRLRPQDIFVINTRFDTTTPAVAAQLASELRTAFPCNRIIGLNGLSFDPSAPGYAFSLVDSPDVFAVMNDYEKDDWNAGRATDPSRPAWTDKFTKAFPLIKGWNGTLAATMAANPVGASRRSGLAPVDESAWSYGQIAQDLDKKNRRLGGLHLGPLSIQTQDACANGGAAGFGARAKSIVQQYKFKTIIKKVKVKGKKKKRKVKIRRKLKAKAKPDLANLSLQISFTGSPNAQESMAILSTGAALAASCVPAGLKQGGGAFLFWASDDSMRLLFQQPQIATLRPATASSANSGGVSP